MKRNNQNMVSVGVLVAASDALATCARQWLKATHCVRRSQRATIETVFLNSAERDVASVERKGSNGFAPHTN